MPDYACGTFNEQAQKLIEQENDPKNKEALVATFELMANDRVRAAEHFRTGFAPWDMEHYCPNFDTLNENGQRLMTTLHKNYLRLYYKT